MKHLDLFSGIGGFALAARWAGWETIGFCEIDPWCQKVLKKHWPDVPIYDDVKELNGRSIGHVDIITGGFPCQDISHAGKGAGIEGSRSGLWTEFARILSEIRPRFGVLENVSALLNGDRGRWFQRVLGDLAEIGYDCEWHCIPASAVGAPHIRDRAWIIAYPRHGSAVVDAEICDREKTKGGGGRTSVVDGYKPILVRRPDRLCADSWWRAQSRMARSSHGISHRVDRLRGLGNAIVPQVAYEIFRAINETV